MFRRLGILFLLAVLWLPSRGQGKDSVRIHQCVIYRPAWWNSIPASLPDSVNSLEDLRQYSNRYTDSLVVMKLWYMGVEKMDLFPAYIGDAWYELSCINEALLCYKQALRCVAGEQGRSDEWECYLLYRIGRCYEAKKEKAVATEWYRKAIDQRFSMGTGKLKQNYELALCAYRCLMNIRCDKQN